MPIPGKSGDGRQSPASVGERGRRELSSFDHSRGEGTRGRGGEGRGNESATPPTGRPGFGLVARGGREACGGPNSANHERGPSLGRGWTLGACRSERGRQYVAICDGLTCSRSVIVPAAPASPCDSALVEGQGSAGRKSLAGSADDSLPRDRSLSMPHENGIGSH